MLKYLKVENFRCFKSLEIDDFRRINVIVGTNAAGKTALLEAVKLALDASPQCLPWLNSFRNIPMFIPANPTAEQFREQFTGFFHGFHHERPIEIWVKDSSQRNAKLSIYFDSKKATSIQQEIGFQPAQPISPTTVVPLAFDRTDFQDQKSTLMATIQPNGQMYYEQGKSMGIVSGLISGTHFGNPPENAMWLSKLNVEKRSKSVVEALRRHFPFVQDVTPEMPYPGIALVCVDIPSVPKKLPLSAVSGGISRIFTFMLAVVTFGGGVLLIDEVENGIFNDQYQLVWNSLIDLARLNDTQLFVSTHSNECLRALLPMIQDNETDFTFLRAEQKNGASTISRFDGKEMGAALAKGAEIRSV